MRTTLIVALLALLPVLLPAQVEVACGPLPTAYSRSIFSKRTANNIQPWSCVATNLGASQATVSEAAMQGWMLRQGVSALSSEAIRIGAGEIKRRGKWATAGRVLPLVLAVGTALIATDGIKINEAWVPGVTSFGGFALPLLGDRLASRDPDDAIFEQLAVHEDVAVAPGASVTLYMWSAPLEGAKTIQGVLAQVNPEPIPAMFNIEPPRQPSWQPFGYGQDTRERPATTSEAAGCSAGGDFEPRQCAAELWAQSQYELVAGL